MRQVQLTPKQSVRDRYVAYVMQSVSLLILYRNNDNPKVKYYVARWHHFSKNCCIKKYGIYYVSKYSLDVLGFLVVHHNYSKHLFV